jgi:hypothetical protein
MCTPTVLAAMGMSAATAGSAAAGVTAASAAVSGSAAAAGIAATAAGVTSAAGLAIPGAAVAAGGMSAFQMLYHGLSTAGTVASAVGSVQQGQFQSQVAKNNALAQQYMVDDALARGRRDEQEHRYKVAAIKGQQRAAFGASGVALDSGSPLEVLGDTAMLGELDALTIRTNAQREAYGHQAAKANYLADSQLSKTKGRYGAAGTLLTGSGRVAESWYKRGSLVGGARL